MEQKSIGIDIGGSHITCQIFDLEQNRLVPKSKVRTAVDGNGQNESILESWTNAIEQTVLGLDFSELAGIGFAMPGPFDYPNGIAWFDKNVDKFQNLHGIDVRSELIHRLKLPAGFPVRFINDAAAFAVGEANVKPVSGFNRIIALTIGTGFGTTFIKNGLPVAGIDGIPEDGFLYHIPFQKSIADEYFSTRWFLGEYKKQTGDTVSGVKELAKLAETNKKASSLFAIFGDNLGSFLVPWIRKFNAECIVIGGNISKSFSLFEKEMNGQFKLNNIETPVFKSALDEDAALIGGAKLCDNKFYSKITTN